MDNVVRDIFKFKYLTARVIHKYNSYLQVFSYLGHTDHHTEIRVTKCSLMRTSATTHEFCVIVNWCVHDVSSPAAALA